MRLPSYLHETIARIRSQRLWGAAYCIMLILPVMLIVARVGMEICGVLIGLLFLLHSARTKNWHWLHQPFTYACLASWAWLVLVVTPFAVNPMDGALEALVWVRFPLLFMALRHWVLAQPEARKSYAVFLLALIALVFVDCMVQLATGTSLTGHSKVAVSGADRLTGPFRSPKPGYFMGMLLLPAAGIALAMALRSTQMKWLVKLLGFGTVILVSILICGERSAFLNGMLGAGILLLLVMCTEPRIRRLGIAMVVLVVLSLGGIYTVSERVQSRVAQMADVMLNYSQSDYGALAIAGVNVGKAHPFTGAGIRGYRTQIPELEFKGQKFTGLHPHNFYVEWFAEAGIPGLLLLLVSIALLVREAWAGFRHGSGDTRIVAAAALGVLAQHFFPLTGSQSYFNNWSGVMQWFSLAIAFAALPRKV
jgi:O-antigen ligase